jgi:hypothetical protein
MALFKKKKKDEEADAGFDDGLGMTGSLAEEEKGGLFGRKKSREEHSEPESETETEEIKGPDDNFIECEICGTHSPPDTIECPTCGGALTVLGGTTEPIEEIPEPEEISVEPQELLESEPGIGPEEPTEPEMPAPDMSAQGHEPDISQEEDSVDDTEFAEPEMTAGESPDQVVEGSESNEMPEPQDPTEPVWTPLLENDEKEARKELKKEMKRLNKALKKNIIDKEEYDKRAKSLLITLHLEPPRTGELAKEITGSARGEPEGIIEEPETVIEMAEDESPEPVEEVPETTVAEIPVAVVEETEPAEEEMPHEVQEDELLDLSLDEPRPDEKSPVDAVEEKSEPDEDTPSIQEPHGDGVGAGVQTAQADTTEDGELPELEKTDTADEKTVDIYENGDLELDDLLVLDEESELEPEKPIWRPLVGAQKAVAEKQLKKD